MKFTGSNKLTSGSRYTLISDLEIDGGKMKGTLNATLGYGSTWSNTGGNGAVVKGVLTNFTLLNAGTWTSTYATGGFFAISLSNPSGYNSNEHIIAGSYSNLTGTISSFPSNGVVSALFARDGINDSLTWAGYFDGKVGVTSKIYAEEVIVKLKSEWADYVFADDYKLLPIKDISRYIDKNKKLPDMPSAKEVESNGISLGETNAKLLRKIEELTLYIIDLNARIEKLEDEISSKEVVSKKD